MSKELEALENIGFEPLCQNEDDSYWRVRDEYKEDFDIIEKGLKALETIKKCFYVAKSSGAILLTDYGFDHKEELKEALL